MNEYLTILTTGALLALFALFAAFLLLTPDSGRHKKSLYHMTALFYIMLLLWNLIFVGAMLLFPSLLMDWRLNLAFNIPLLSFITFVVMEMLYPDKSMDAKTFFLHTAFPFALLVAYLLTYSPAPAAAVWLFWLLVIWGVVYVAVMLPLAIVRIRRYNALVREIFVDADGHSLAWLARLSSILFVCYVLYGFFSLYDLNFLTTWIFNVFEFAVYMVFGLQVSRMRCTTLVRIDQSEEELNLEQQDEDAVAESAESDAAAFVTKLEEWLMADGHLGSPDLNRDMMARAMGISHVTLGRILREQTGMTLSQFVTDLRMREAERLLLNRNLSIEEIIYHVGYQTRSTFTRAFRERNHCTATQWREQHAK